jgi:putative SOS response-associated peptidase YedK
VVLNDDKYQAWLHADHKEAKALLNFSPDYFLVSDAAPK